MWLLVVVLWLLVSAGTGYWYLFGRPSPFSLESVRAPAPLELDRKKRDKVLKQGFTREKVPQDLDVVVVGSGIGGMTVAATLAKLGKRVLVLEQHDQAGGCCHTFTERGFEFDVGLHYVGQLHENSLFKVVMDQITEGQVQFAELDQHFDTVGIGYGADCKDYTIFSGKDVMEKHLKKQFPHDTKAVEEFFKIMKFSARHTPLLGALKLFPRWLSVLLMRSGLADLCSSIFSLSGTSASALFDGLTSNKDLQLVFSYYFYGVPPRDASSVLNALMLHHFKRGAYYPVGGASEIPFHITKVIQKFGGNVLVRAPVNRILVDSKGAAYGVSVRKGQDNVEVLAPVVISNTGVFNTFSKLLPPEIQSRPEIQRRLDIMRPGKASFLLFSGFDATQEELGISDTSYWLFRNNDMDAMMDNFFSLGKDEAPENIPMMFLTFPSAKDPTSKTRHPGKTSMIILTMVNYEWFEEWRDTTVKRRGDDYKQYKTRFADHLFDWACERFPKLREKCVFMDSATPLSNSHYLNAFRGSIYSADQNLQRYTPEMMTENRCDTPIKNLYISGQDLFSCGIVGALHGGLMCASTVLGQIIYVDLMMMKRKLKRRKAREMVELAKKKLL